MGYLTYLAPPPPCKQALGEERPQKCDVMEDSAFITVQVVVQEGARRMPGSV